MLAALICAGIPRFAEAQEVSSVVVQNPPPAASASSQGNVTNLGNITVVGKLEEARSQIVPALGATAYSVDKQQIAAESRGDNAPFNQILLRAPGVAQDSLSQLHLRGEHANLQYRINDVLLPEGITGFGQELDPRFVDSLQLITGSLPAQYGFRTAGIVDIQTKSGAFSQGGEASLYGGSFNTVRPSFEYGGAQGKLNYFVDGSYEHNGIGIENPTAGSTPIHDNTDQLHAFSYMSYLLSDTSQVSVMLSASHSDFQIPDSPNLAAGTAPGGNVWLPGTFDSTQLNENQTEQNYYVVAAFQKSADDLNYQIAGFGRYSGVKFKPDPAGDLFFNGVASQVQREIYSTGVQGDLSYKLTDTHTLRAGAMVLDETAPTHSTTTVFALDGSNNPTGAPFPVTDNNTTNAQFYGIYLQDEWKVTRKFTLNYGARFDIYASTLKENQLSPRVNAIYQATPATTLHAGYARYFTPPPLESVNTAGVAQFAGTSNAPEVTQNDPVKSERAHYFDVGVTHKITPEWQVGLDGYYKYAKNQLDDGFFGQTLIPSAFNYSQGRIYGAEFTTSYATGGFSTYANFAYSVAQGRNINSAQTLFGAADQAYIQNHWVYLDHDQRETASLGASYVWKQSMGSSTRVYMDALYGSGLRKGQTLPDGSTIPNGAHEPGYWTMNAGIEQDCKIGANRMIKLRLDVVNFTDKVYELRDGSGIGVNAAQFGMRMGFFGSISCEF